MKRPGSSKHQFVKRIPSDLKKRMVGKKLSIPIGDETAHITVTPKMDAIRCSLRSSVSHEVKGRQADAAAYVEAIFKSVRESAPVSLTHRQAVALSGRVYRSWAGDLEDMTHISMVHTEHGWVRDYDGFAPSEMETVYQSALRHLGDFDDAEPEEIEKIVGPLVDRLLLDNGIASVDRTTRQVLLAEFLKALREGMEVRRRKAGGDYSPDPNSERFPEWQPPDASIRENSGSESTVTIGGLLDGWWNKAQASGASESTHQNYKKAVASLVKFLRHDAAAQVTPTDMIALRLPPLATSRAR